MKVIHLISGGDSGGAKTHVLSLLQGLSRSIVADLICFTDGPFAQQARDLGIHVDIISGNHLLKALKELKDYICRGGYDIIHCHGARGNLMGALLQYFCRLPVVTTVHSDPKLDYLGRFFSRLVFGSLNRWALRQIPYHIGVSDYMVDLLVDRGIVKQHFFSIYNGISFDPVPEGVDRMTYLRNLGVDVEPDSVVAGIAARLDPVKDIATLIRGFAAAQAKCPRLRLVIAGDGEEREVLEALVRDLGVTQQVSFVGWIDNGMDDFYRALDINTLTSLSETFPYALTEGARFKLATVASAVGGIPHLIDDGENGFLFTASDWEGLSEHLARLGNDDTLRRTLGSRLYQKASARFSIQRTIEAQLDIYEKILADHSRKRTTEKTGILICGAYGRGNVGDEAILQAIVTQLRSVNKEIPICVMSRNPRLTRKNHQVQSIYTFNPFTRRRTMSRCRLFLQGGGTLIQNVTSRRSLWFYLSTLKAAHKQGCRVMMYGCGIGPVRYRADRRRAAEIINETVDCITLRDPHSMEELKALGVTAPHIALAADPTITLSAAPEESAAAMLEAAGLHPKDGQRYLGICLRNWPGFDQKAPVIAAAVARIFETSGLLPVFIPIEPKSDLSAAAKVAAHLTDTPHVILPGYTRFDQTAALLARMDGVISMRLHGLIYPVIHGIPSVGIVYDPKVRAFLECMEQGCCLSLDELSTQRLTQLFDTAVDSRNRLPDQAVRLLKLERNNLLLAQTLYSFDER